MALELTVTAKGQVTLLRAVLDHLGIVSGTKVSVSFGRNAGGDRGGRRPVRIAVDTNVLVRYLTWDDEAQAIEAANAIERADAIVVPTICCANWCGC
jgi:predicted nucleic-acid-binding protein